MAGPTGKDGSGGSPRLLNLVPLTKAICERLAPGPPLTPGRVGPHCTCPGRLPAGERWLPLACRRLSRDRGAAQGREPAPGMLSCVPIVACFSSQIKNGCQGPSWNLESRRSLRFTGLRDEWASLCTPSPVTQAAVSVVCHLRRRGFERTAALPRSADQVLRNRLHLPARWG